MSDEKAKGRGANEAKGTEVTEATGRPVGKPSAATDDLMMTKALYPNAAAIFSGQPRSLDAVKGDCLFVLDTNVLLLPFGVGKQSLEQLRKVYGDLIKRGQLVVPGHAAREFAKNRSKKLAELYQFVSRRRNVVSVESKSYPLLEGSDDYKRVIEIEKQINGMSAEYNKAINRLLERIASWRWNDPVSDIYKDLFTETVVYDPDFEVSAIRSDLERRQLHKLPPGYKDTGKEENSSGDLLIWHTILNVAKDKRKDVVFVSGDLKADWWTPSEGRGLYPRYELVDEFREKTDGRTFHIIELSQLLDIFGANQSIVQEVQVEESRAAITSQLSESASVDKDEKSKRTGESKAINHFIRWLRAFKGVPYVPITRSRGELLDAGGLERPVHIHVVSNSVHGADIKHKIPLDAMKCLQKDRRGIAGIIFMDPPSVSDSRIEAVEFARSAFEPLIEIFAGTVGREGYEPII